MFPVNSLFKRPVTAEDIASIEEEIDTMICALFPPGERREIALAMALPDKIQGYIDIAKYAKSGTAPQSEPDLEATLRGLLTLANGYYHTLN